MPPSNAARSPLPAAVVINRTSSAEPLSPFLANGVRDRETISKGLNQLRMTLVLRSLALKRSSLTLIGAFVHIEQTTIAWTMFHLGLSEAWRTM
jgi:hypothetical protein